jgi:hypothetical protein
MTHTTHRFGWIAILLFALLLGSTIGASLAARAETPASARTARSAKPEKASPALSTKAALAALESEDVATRVLAAEALANHAEAGDLEAISALIGLLDAQPSKLRYHASWGLARSGAAAVPTLRAAYAREPDDARRAAIVQTLGKIGLAARAATPELLAALDDPHSTTAIRAAGALAAMRVREALPALVRTYAAARKLSSQREVARAIDVIGSDQSARAARNALIDSLEADLTSPDDELRRASIAYTVELFRVVGDTAPNHLPTSESLVVLVPLLERALDDAEADTLAIVRGLGYAGGNAAAAVPKLGALLQDPEVAREAAHALESIGTANAKRILAERAALAALEKRIRQEYSLPDHQGRMRLLPFYVLGKGTEGIRMETRFLYTGTEVRRPTHIVLAFESYSPEARFSSLATIHWKADAQSIVMRGVDHSLGSSSIGVIERFSAILPVERFQALVAANRIEGRLASVGFELAAEDRAALRHFATKIPLPAPASPTSPP